MLAPEWASSCLAIYDSPPNPQEKQKNGLWAPTTCRATQLEVTSVLVSAIVIPLEQSADA